MNSWLGDVRLAWREIRKHPGISLLAVVTLGLGLGSTSTMFQLSNVLLLTPPVYQEADRLVSLYSHDSETHDYRAFSHPDFEDLSADSRIFERLTAHNMSMAGLEEEGLTRRAFVDVVGPNYFETFGVVPMLGRTFLAEETRPESGAAVAILSFRAWQRRGGGQGVVGSSISLNGEPYTVVGVAPRGFGGSMSLIAPDLFVPFGSYDRLMNDFMNSGPLRSRENHSLFLIGRWRAGLNGEQGRAELLAAGEALATSFPEVNRNQVLEAFPLSRFSVSTSPIGDGPLAAVSLLLVGIGSVVLLIAALNLSTLQNARALARRRAVAVRFALGSPRWPIVRQSLVEGLLLALVGGALGLIAALVIPQFLASSIRRLAPVEIDLRSTLDWRVLGATLLFCVLATLVFAMPPALRSLRSNLAAQLVERQDSDAGGRPGRFGARGLGKGGVSVVMQIALAAALLVVGGLFLKAVWKAAGADPGFSIAGQVVAELDPSLAGFDQEGARRVFERVVERLSGLPGVESVSTGATIPYGMVSLGRSVQARPPGSESDSDAEAVGASFNLVGKDYFSGLGIPLRRGREFRREEGAPVAVVSESLAAKLWPAGEAVGRTLYFAGEHLPGPKVVEVVGVVGDVRLGLGREKGEQIYVPYGQELLANQHVHLRFRDGASRGGTPPVEALEAVRRAILEVEPRVPILQLRTLRRHLDSSLEYWVLRIAARIFSTFAVLALGLSVAGIYGLRAWGVARRTHEIGLRMALGATSSDTLWEALREGFRIAAWGCGLGVLLALGASRLLRSFLSEVSAVDPWVIGGSVAILVAALLVACYFPARRASRLNPLLALRTD